MKKTVKKLALSRETLRNLNEDLLGTAEGAVENSLQASRCLLLRDRLHGSAFLLHLRGRVDPRRAWTAFRGRPQSRIPPLGTPP